MGNGGWKQGVAWVVAGINPLHLRDCRALSHTLCHWIPVSSCEGRYSEPHLTNEKKTDVLKVM